MRLTNQNQMATYNKRGYKAPKPKDDKLDDQYLDDVKVDDSDSTTAEIFNTLDESANRTEAWVERNQKVIFSIVGLIALLAVGYVLYQNFIVEPKEEEAANMMFTAQQKFQAAGDGVQSDSLYNLALKGTDGKPGFEKIASDYSGTAAGNLANYYAGMAYLHIGKYTEAIASLDKFSSKDEVLSVLAKGALGDAFAQKNQLKEALDYYVKASEMQTNNFTTPMFLLKAGQTALALGNKADANKYFTKIKDKYESTPEGQGIDGLIGMTQ